MDVVSLPTDRPKHLEYHAYEGYELGVPVIDAVLSPFKTAEFLAEVAARFGWKPSRKWGSQAPPETEVSAWNLFP